MIRHRAVGDVGKMKRRPKKGVECVLFWKRTPILLYSKTRVVIRVNRSGGSCSCRRQLWVLGRRKKLSQCGQQATERVTSPSAYNLTQQLQ